MEELIQEAKALGIPNPTLYRLVPVDRRLEGLKKDICKAKESATDDK